MISDEDFLRLFNVAMALAKPVGKSTINAELIDVRFENIEVDSLDLLIIGMYLCDAFDVSEEKGKEMRPETVGQMKEFLVANSRLAAIDVNGVLQVMV
jgi:acyl carrier protein